MTSRRTRRARTACRAVTTALFTLILAVEVSTANAGCWCCAKSAPPSCAAPQPQGCCHQGSCAQCQSAPYQAPSPPPSYAPPQQPQYQTVNVPQTVMAPQTIMVPQVFMVPQTVMAPQQIMTQQTILVSASLPPAAANYPPVVANAPSAPPSLSIDLADLLRAQAAAAPRRSPPRAPSTSDCEEKLRRLEEEIAGIEQRLARMRSIIAE